MPPTLDLFPIGNCAVSALIDRSGRFVWACAPRVDSDPVFSALLDDAAPSAAEAKGLWDIVVEGAVSVEQAYLRNTPILRTEITDADGARIEILDPQQEPPPARKRQIVCHNRAIGMAQMQRAVGAGGEPGHNHVTPPPCQTA